MGKSSYYGYIKRIAATTFGEDQPVSALQAFLLRNNLLHLADEFCQHRINWCAGMDAGGGVGGNGCFANIAGLADETDAIYEQEFPHIWLNPSHPGNLDILIRSSVTADAGSPEMDVRVRVVPWHYDPNDLGKPALIDETHTVTTTPGLWSDQFFFDANDAAVMNMLRSAAMPRAFEVIEDGEWHYPEVSMLKLQVQLKYVDGTAPLFYLLTGVTVREFA